MNERIKELAEHCTSYNNSDGWLFDKEKFAELVVKECSELTLDYKNDEHYAGWIDYRELIKQHFGIEE
jgi:hypothetical protein